MDCAVMSPASCHSGLSPDDDTADEKEEVSLTAVFLAHFCSPEDRCRILRDYGGTSDEKAQLVLAMEKLHMQEEQAANQSQQSYMQVQPRIPSADVEQAIAWCGQQAADADAASSPGQELEADEGGAEAPGMHAAAAAADNVPASSSTQLVGASRSSSIRGASPDTAPCNEAAAVPGAEAAVPGAAALGALETTAPVKEQPPQTKGHHHHRHHHKHKGSNRFSLCTPDLPHLQSLSSINGNAISSSSSGSASPRNDCSGSKGSSSAAQLPALPQDAGKEADSGKGCKIRRSTESSSSSGSTPSRIFSPPRFSTSASTCSSRRSSMGQVPAAPPDADAAADAEPGLVQVQSSGIIVEAEAGASGKEGTGAAPSACAGYDADIGVDTAPSSSSKPNSSASLHARSNSGSGDLGTAGKGGAPQAERVELSPRPRSESKYDPFKPMYARQRSSNTYALDLESQMNALKQGLEEITVTSASRSSEASQAADTQAADAPKAGAPAPDTSEDAAITDPTDPTSNIAATAAADPPSDVAAAAANGNGTADEDDDAAANTQPQQPPPGRNQVDSGGAVEETGQQGAAADGSPGSSEEGGHAHKEGVGRNFSFRWPSQSSNQAGGSMRMGSPSQVRLSDAVHPEVKTAAPDAFTPTKHSEGASRSPRRDGKVAALQLLVQQLTSLKAEVASRKPASSLSSSPSVKLLPSPHALSASTPAANFRCASLPVTSAAAATAAHAYQLPTPRSSSFATPRPSPSLVAASKEVGVSGAAAGSPASPQAARLAELQAKAFQLLATMDRQAAASGRASVRPSQLPTPLVAAAGGSAGATAAATDPLHTGLGHSSPSAKAAGTVDDIKVRALGLLQQQGEQPPHSAPTLPQALPPAATAPPLPALLPHTPAALTAAAMARPSGTSRSSSSNSSNRHTASAAAKAGAEGAAAGAVGAAPSQGGAGKSQTAAAARLEELQAKAMRLMVSRSMPHSPPTKAAPSTTAPAPLLQPSASAHLPTCMYSPRQSPLSPSANASRAPFAAPSSEHVAHGPSVLHSSGGALQHQQGGAGLEEAPGSPHQPYSLNPAESLAIRQRALDLLSPSASAMHAMGPVDNWPAAAAPPPGASLEASTKTGLQEGGRAAAAPVQAETKGRDAIVELQSHDSEGSWKVWSPKDI